MSTLSRRRCSHDPRLASPASGCCYSRGACATFSASSRSPFRGGTRSRAVVTLCTVCIMHVSNYDSMATENSGGGTRGPSVQVGGGLDRRAAYGTTRGVPRTARRLRAARRRFKRHRPTTSTRRGASFFVKDVCPPRVSSMNSNINLHRATPPNLTLLAFAYPFLGGCFEWEFIFVRHYVCGSLVV